MPKRANIIDTQKGIYNMDNNNRKDTNSLITIYLEYLIPNKTQDKENEDN